MCKSLAIGLGIVAACIPVLLWAQVKDDGSYKRLEGTYSLYSGSLGDTAPPTLKDASLNLQFDGAMARKMYYYMGKSSEYHDECDNMTIRAKGDLECSEYQGKFSCSIGVNLKTGKTTGGTIC